MNAFREYTLESAMVFEPQTAVLAARGLRLQSATAAKLLVKSRDRPNRTLLGHSYVWDFPKATLMKV